MSEHTTHFEDCGCLSKKLSEENEKLKDQLADARSDAQCAKYDLSLAKTVFEAAKKVRTHFARNAKPRLNSDDVVAILELNEALKALDADKGSAG